MSGDVEAIATAWMLHQGYTQAEIDADEADLDHSLCEMIPGVGWDCVDEDGSDRHPERTALIEACEMANVALEAIAAMQEHYKVMGGTPTGDFADICSCGRSYWPCDLAPEPVSLTTRSPADLAEREVCELTPVEMEQLSGVVHQNYFMPDVFSVVGQIIAARLATPATDDGEHLNIEYLTKWALREFGVSNGTQAWVEFQGSPESLAQAVLELFPPTPNPDMCALCGRPTVGRATYQASDGPELHLCHSGSRDCYQRWLWGERPTPEPDGDEHHTMDELYAYRMAYHANAVRGWLASGTPVVKSWKHSDGELCFGGGWFIVVAQLATGQVSNHYAAEHWKQFDIPEVELPPEYDGHTPGEALVRLLDHASLRTSEPDVEVVVSAEQVHEAAFAICRGYHTDKGTCPSFEVHVKQAEDAFRAAGIQVQS